MASKYRGRRRIFWRIISEIISMIYRQKAGEYVCSICLYNPVKDQDDICEDCFEKS